MLSIGLMSGTSMDGIDAALLETDGTAHVLRELGHCALHYNPAYKILLKAAEYAVRQCGGDVAQASVVYPQAVSDYLAEAMHLSESEMRAALADALLYLYGTQHTSKQFSLADVIAHSTALHAAAVQQLLMITGYRTEQIDVIGYHGQTLLHRPDQRISIIVGDGVDLAEQLGITVVNDFRSCDIAAGGQGAPLAPIYHHALALRDHLLPVAVVNCGGIANISFVQSHAEEELLAFDTGPGNGLIDRLVRARTHGQECMDLNGHYGLQGSVSESVLARLYATAIIKNGKNYFLLPPPKSLDIGDMILIQELDGLSLEDACATLEAFTADTIVRSLELISAEIPRHWVLAGGGWNNPVILRELKQRLNHVLGADVVIQTADAVGWNSQAMEAQLMAYAAVRSLQNKPLSMPGTTRVPAPMSGGCTHVPTGGSTEKVHALLQASN